MTEDDTIRTVTRLLEGVREGDRGAWSRLLPVVYDELRRIARYRLRRLPPGATLLTTDLVHESFLRFVGTSASWEDRSHFFRAASLAMRDVLVDEARKRRRLKRGGDWQRIGFDESLLASDDRDVELLALHEALGKLEAMDSEQHTVVVLRYFGGLKIDEVAEVLHVSASTVDRQWRFAKAWLFRELSAP